MGFRLGVRKPCAARLGPARESEPNALHDLRAQGAKKVGLSGDARESYRSNTRPITSVTGGHKHRRSRLSEEIGSANRSPGRIEKQRYVLRRLSIYHDLRKKKGRYGKHEKKNNTFQPNGGSLQRDKRAWRITLNLWAKRSSGHHSLWRKIIETTKRRRERESSEKNKGVPQEKSEFLHIVFGMRAQLGQCGFKRNLRRSWKKARLVCGLRTSIKKPIKNGVRPRLVKRRLQVKGNLLR